MFAKTAQSKTRNVMAATALAVVLVAGAPSIAEACGPKGFIKTVGTKMLSAAKSGSTGSFRSLINSYADVGAIGNFALGRYRKLVPASDQAAYRKSMANFMAKTMAQYSKKFRAIGVQIGRCSSSKVTSKLIRNSGRAQPVVWKVRRAGGGYKVVDLQVQNVWLGPLMRSTFSSVIKKGGGNINALYAYLGIARRTVGTSK
ncbi:MAG: ABC transporter substrate-binding protein [Alphaproteobacteria bacterium]|nr:ABC transporter substrate-binding protein [Alphaproteobacteria bacterium]